MANSHAWGPWAQGEPVVLERKDGDRDDNWYSLTALDEPDEPNMDSKHSKLEVKYASKQFSAQITLDENSAVKRADVIDAKYFRIILHHYKPQETIVFDLETGAILNQDYCDPRMHAPDWC